MRIIKLNNTLQTPVYDFDEVLCDAYIDADEVFAIEETPEYYMEKQRIIEITFKNEMHLFCVEDLDTLYRKIFNK